MVATGKPGDLVDVSLTSDAIDRIHRERTRIFGRALLGKRAQGRDQRVATGRRAEAADNIAGPASGLPCKRRLIHGLDRFACRSDRPRRNAATQRVVGPV